MGGSNEAEKESRVRKCAGVDKRVRWLERENRVSENQKACTSVYARQKNSGVEEGEQANTCDNQSLPPVK